MNLTHHTLSLRVRSVLALCAIAMAILPVGILAGSASAQTGAASQRDVQYGDDSGEPLLLDVYGGGGGSEPAIVLVHPGGFVGGDKADPDVVKVAEFYAGHGYVVFDINYPSAREGFPYPSQYRDVEAAVAWVRANGAQYGADPERIAVFGASAGATLAVTAGLDGSGPLDTGSRVAAIVSWSAALDLVSVAEQNQNALEGLYTYVTGKKGQRANRSGGISVEEIRSQLEQANPVNLIDPSDPPVFIANATQEFMPLNQAKETEAKLKAAGVPVTFFQPAQGHALAYTDEALQPTLDFLKQHLDAYRAAPTTPPPSPTPSKRHRAGGDGGTGGGSVPVGLVAGGAGILVLVGGVFALVRWRQNAVYRR